jgi:hypothetical protein
MTQRSATLSFILMFFGDRDGKGFRPIHRFKAHRHAVEKVAPTRRTFGEEFYRELHDAPLTARVPKIGRRAYRYDYLRLFIHDRRSQRKRIRFARIAAIIRDNEDRGNCRTRLIRWSAHDCRPCEFTPAWEDVPRIFDGFHSKWPVPLGRVEIRPTYEIRGGKSVRAISEFIAAVQQFCYSVGNRLGRVNILARADSIRR